MPATSPETVVTALNWRYATKQFDPSKKIPSETWKALEQSLVLSPSSYGLQPWKFVVVTDPALRAKLRPVSWNQPQITDASHMVVLCRRTGMDAKEVHRYAELISKVRGVPVSAFQGYVDMMLGTVNNFPAGFDVNAWNSKQVYIALGFFLSACAMLGVDACPMEGIDTGKYDEILDLKATGYATVVVATAGYRAATDPVAGMKKVRYATGDVVVKK
jgi:nitroreductase